MIDKEKLDGVMVETTTHARAWIVIQAMQAGLDTYIEKPMGLTIAEGRTMVKAARKFNRVTQVGTQQRSMPMNNWASDLVRNGAIGKILTVMAPNYCRSGTLDENLVNRPQGPSGSLVGRVDEPGGIAAVRYGHPPRLGQVVGLRRRRPQLRCHRLGHPLLRSNQPRLGHGRTGPVEVILEEPLAIATLASCGGIRSAGWSAGAPVISTPAAGSSAAKRDTTPAVTAAKIRARGPR